MEKNFYEILNLDEKLIPYFLKTDQVRDIENGSDYRNQKIKEAYEEQIKEMKVEYNKRLEKLKREKELKIGAKKLVIEKKYTSKKVREANQRAIEEEEQKFKEKLIELKGEYELKMQELDVVYESVKTEELRQKYNNSINNPDEKKTYIEYMRGITTQIENEIKKKQIEERYSKADKYNPELIKTISDGQYKGQKLVLRENLNNPAIISLKDERNIKIKQTGILHFANFMGCKSYVNEYQIVRYVHNQQKVDTVYTILNLPELGFNKDTNKPANPKYYDCVVNKLLSEETIEGSKYNKGYIGLVEKDRCGYDITIDKKMSEEEQENLTAIMIVKKRKEIINQLKNNKQKKGEDR